MTLRVDQLPSATSVTDSDLLAVEQGGILKQASAAMLAALSLSNPMTTTGDIIVAGASGVAHRLGIGSTGQVPTVNSSGTLVYSFPGGITTDGDLSVGGSGGVPQRLPPGASGTVLTSQGAGAIPNWTSVLNNPMMAANDLIIGGTAGAPSRLAGPTADGLLLKRVGGVLGWNQDAGNAFPNVIGVSGTQTLTAANSGQYVLPQGSTTYTITMPAAATMQQGATISFWNINTANISIALNSADNCPSITFPIGLGYLATLCMVAQPSTNQWFIVNSWGMVGLPYPTRLAINGGAYTPVVTVAAAASPSFNCAASNVFTHNPNQAISPVLQNAAAGQTINIRINGGGTVYGITYPSNWYFPSGAVTTLSGGTDMLVLTIYSDIVLCSLNRAY